MLWIGWFALVIFATTTPWWKFDGSPHWESIRWIPFADLTWSEGDLLEAAANLLLFVPLGYLTVRATWAENTSPLMMAGTVALICSVGAEVYEIFCEARVPSTTDISVNVAGSLIGALAAVAVDRALGFFALSLRSSH